MHIPDSVLSPSTCAVCGAAMLPVWTLAARRLRARLTTKQVPLLALGAAFSFTVMLFNIPALGGTTAHPVAGALLAIALDPWAAVIGVSVALAIQALFFGDGGLLAFGANCFTMAFVLPFVGASVYRVLLSLVGRWGGDRARQKLAYLCAGVGAYIGLNAAAAVVALLLGLQPALFHEPNGHALFFPFGLHITLPAMLGTHLIIAGPAEAIVTALVVLYLQALRVPLYGLEQAEEGVAPRGRRREALWIGLLALAALSPLGLLAKGDAWGEWDAKGIAEQTEKVFGLGHGYVPQKIAEAEEKGYKGLHGLQDYGQPEAGKSNSGYLLAALLGVGTIAGLLLVSGRLLARRGAARNLGAASSAPT
ncbi:MAG TPA: cobalt transporter CbiM, partial [Chthonomonadaceae bacterium]|nr:cobalt transporter CbiM [Chthonomonadaceae bacterium]